MNRPIAIKKSNQNESDAYLGEQWLAPGVTDRETELCGELNPKLQEVEIYSIDGTTIFN